MTTYDEALKYQSQQPRLTRANVDHAAELLLSAVNFERAAALELLEDVRALIWAEAELRRRKHEDAEALRLEVGY